MPDKLPWEPSGKSRPMTRAGIVVDLGRCVGCHACSVSCKTEHDVALGGFRTRVRYLERPGRTQLAFLPLLCMHCEDAPCLPACPTQAMTRGEDGRVFVDESKCKGSSHCIEACPYDAIHLDPQTGLADKCDLCRHRTDVGMDPACVATCPSRALSFGDLGDPDDPVTRAADESDARGFREASGTKPTVRYIGLRPWMEQATKGGVQLHPDEDEIVYVQKKQK